MKNIFSLLTILTLSFLIQSCNKKDAITTGVADFSNSLTPYVELTSTTTKTVKQGNSTTFTFQMRTALQQPVTITYNVTGGGVNLMNQTATIDRNKLTGTATVTIPAGVIVPPSTSAQATLTVVKAVTSTGTQLTLGQKNTPGTQKVTINITP